MSITVQKFIDGYKKVADDKKVEFIEKHILRTYMPYEDKISKCRDIVNITSFVDYPDGNGGTKQMFQVNSTTRYMLFALAVVDYYTDIEFDLAAKSLETFNLLDKENLFERIFEGVGDAEMSKLNTVMDMVFSDTVENNHSVASVIERKFAAIGGVLDTLLGGFGDVLGGMIEATNNEVAVEDEQAAEPVIEQVK